MRLLLVLLAAAAFAAPAGATLETVVLAPADDVSLPFLCSRGYDWQERCYRYDLDRLELGGADDKVWRSALRFPLEGLPAGATVVTRGALAQVGRDLHGAAPADGAVRRTRLTDWYSGALANDGVLLKLIDDQEQYAVGGPALPSSSYPDSALRPRLVVWLMT